MLQPQCILFYNPAEGVRACAAGSHPGLGGGKGLVCTGVSPEPGSCCLTYRQPRRLPPMSGLRQVGPPGFLIEHPLLLFLQNSPLSKNLFLGLF